MLDGCRVHVRHSAPVDILKSGGYAWMVANSSLSHFFARSGPSGMHDSAVIQGPTAILHTSPVPKCEGPVAPSSALGIVTETGATRLIERLRPDCGRLGRNVKSRSLGSAE